MKFKRFSVLLLALATTGVLSASSTINDVKLVGNMPENSGGLQIDNTNWVAMSITTSAVQKLYMSDIQLSLDRMGAPATKTYLFRVFTSVAGTNGEPALVPGRLLGSFSVPKFESPAYLAAGSQATGRFLLTANRGILLQPSTTYFIIAYSTNTSTTDYIAWDTTTNAPTGAAGYTIGTPNTVGTYIETSTNQGTSWSTYVPPMGAATPTLQVDVLAD